MQAAGRLIPLHLSPNESLSQALLVPGTHIVAERSGPLGGLTVVGSPQTPLRHAQGLSLLASQTPLEQLALFTDGDAMTAITRDTRERETLAWLDQNTSALAYHLGPLEHVLIRSAGAGMDALQARYHLRSR